MDIPVEKLIVHENYQGLPTVLNDIALIRLAEDVDFNHINVDMICLPKTSELRHERLDNKVAMVAGWGIMENDTESTVLNKADIYIAENCSGLYNSFARLGLPDITADKVCAGSQNKDSCIVDPGGHLIMKMKYNNIYRYIMSNTDSHGPQLCGSDYSVVYTDVTKFMGWILGNMY